MVARALVTGFSNSSKAVKIGASVLLLLLVLIPLGVHWWHTATEAGLRKDAVKLKEENRQMWDDYWQAIGERNALRVQAQAAKVEADAYREQGAQRGANVAALDKKIGEVREQYDEIQTSVGDCNNVADCRKQLCDKYKAAGVRLSRCAD